MIIAALSVNRSRCIKLRVLALILAILASTVSPRSTSAANDWCSRDPSFHFRRDGGLLGYTVDVQVQVPLSALPVDGATLDVLIPANIDATVVDVSTPLFNLDTRIVATKPRSVRGRYPIDLALFVPASATAFPVRIVITDVQRLRMVVFEGVAGQELHKSYQVGF
jgi:hypothetical protein